MKKSFFYILLLCWFSVQAQKEANIWYFGNNAGIDFNSGVPVPLLDGQLDHVEGSASIADVNGNLLFYTDGITVYNRNHQIMPNGSGLLGDDTATNSALIVPKPNDPEKYYIFTADRTNKPDGVNYSELDISLDGA